MDVTSIVVRPATADDAVGIANVHVAGWRFAYRDILPRPFLDALSVDARSHQWRQGIEHAAPRSRTIVATLEDWVIGFCHCGASRDRDAPNSRGEVFAIYVEPACLRRGVGRQLMDAALKALARERFLNATLWVVDSNEIGRRFYERYGWTADGATRTDAIGDVEVTEVRYSLVLLDR